MASTHFCTHHAICARVSLLHALGFLQGLLANHLHPVAVGVQDKRNVAHAPVSKLLLELVACIFEALARGLEVVD